MPVPLLCRLVKLSLWVLPHKSQMADRKHIEKIYGEHGGQSASQSRFQQQDHMCSLCRAGLSKASCSNRQLSEWSFRCMVWCSAQSKSDALFTFERHCGGSRSLSASSKRLARLQQVLPEHSPSPQAGFFLLNCTMIGERKVAAYSVGFSGVRMHVLVSTAKHPPLESCVLQSIIVQRTPTISKPRLVPGHLFEGLSRCRMASCLNLFFEF